MKKQDIQKTGFIKSRILILAVFFIALLSVAVILYCKGASDGTGNLSADSQEGKRENISVELFVLAPCESCHEEEKFEQEVLHNLSAAGIENPDCTVYNVYKDSGASHFEKTVEQYELELTIIDLPAAVVEGVVYRGTYHEIGEAVAHYLGAGEEDGKPISAFRGTEAAGLGEGGKEETKENSEDDSLQYLSQSQEILAGSVFYRQILEVGENDILLVLFVTGACESCHTAEAYLQDQVVDEKCNLLIYNILEEDNMAALRKLMGLYGVPESGQQVPILFSRKSFLSGAEAIVKGTAGMLADREAAGSWEEIVSGLSQEEETIKISKLQLIVTGFLNGMNPCGISMLLMILSILLMSKRSFYGGSLVYLAGKFITYLFLGFTIGTLLGMIESTIFQTLQKGMKVVFSVLALSFGFFYLMDFIHVLKKEYGREKLRLPKRFRKWNHTVIKKLTDIPESFWYPVLFLLGIVISAGEFLCTGQVYLASLLYMVKQNGGFDMPLAGNLALYLTAMCVPMVLVVMLVSRGKSVMSASHLSLKILPAVKLAYSVFFFALFVSLLF